MSKFPFESYFDDDDNYYCEFDEFRAELYAVGSSSQIVNNVMDRLREWRVNNDPSYLDLAIVLLSTDGVAIPPMITKELAKVAWGRLNGDYKPSESGKSMRNAMTELALNQAMHWITLLNTYCGITKHKASKMAATLLLAKFPTMESFEASTLEKRHPQLVSKTFINNLKKTTPEWSAADQEKFIKQFPEIAERFNKSSRH
ncbi:MULTISPECIES: hypothetical protein [unclassified Shewanella]|uniref:hypothetical protein n=1 Tax=unclassified Shewanella TaxID=196818 RepID=UPI000C825297|nr:MULTISPECIES: hypothetical protein [unclassified Shewanella]MDO6679388.1 hypothetical protein [Shewanella sp. 4_MG-2023]PMG51491.1 hypothetical protein BCU91_16525 [Shewanella sp. 10N.286.52.B9]